MCGAGSLARDDLARRIRETVGVLEARKVFHVKRQLKLIGFER